MRLLKLARQVALVAVMVLTIVGAVSLTMAACTPQESAATTNQPKLEWIEIGDSPFGNEIYVACDITRHVLLYYSNGTVSAVYNQGTGESC